MRTPDVRKCVNEANRVGMKALILLTFLASTNTEHGISYNPYTFFTNFSTYTTALHTYSYHYNSNDNDASIFQVPPGSQGHHPNVLKQPSHTFREVRQQEPFYPAEEADSGFEVEARQADNPGSIVFPGNANLKNMAGTNCAYGLCDEVKDYPADLIKDLFNKNKEFDAFFNSSEVPTIASKGVGTPENICSSTLELRFPKLALNTKQKQRLIANVDQFKQGVKIETCNEKKSKCQFSNFWPKNYESICEQKYLITPLVALDDDNKPMVDTFQTPSCCVCMYKVA